MNSDRKDFIEKIVNTIIDDSKKYIENNFEPSYKEYDSLFEQYRDNIFRIDGKDIYEINNVVDERINNIIFNKEERSQIQEYIESYIKCLFAYFESDKQRFFYYHSDFLNLIDYIGKYLINHINAYSVILENIELATKDYKRINDKTIKETNDKVKSLKDELLETKDEAEESKRKANETSIAILGVFSALVLAFNGATLFASSTLEAINSASIYRLVAIVILLGTVFVNIAYALFNFIGNLIERNSLVKENEDAKKTIKTINWKHLKTVNLVALVIILVVISCWLGGIVEKRNNCIESSITTTVAIQQEEKDSIQEDMSKETIVTTSSNNPN